MVRPFRIASPGWSDYGPCSMPKHVSPPIPTRFPTRAAIDHYQALFDLGDYGQDWEIEVADGDRVAELLGEYDAGFPDDDHAFSLMALIVASYDELLRTDATDSRTEWLWQRIDWHLRDRFELHAYTVQYWACVDVESDDPDMLFPVTPRMREIMQSIYGPQRAWPRQPFVVARAEIVGQQFVERPPGLSPEVFRELRSLGENASLSLELVNNQNRQGFTICWMLYRADKAGGGRVLSMVHSGEMWFSSEEDALRRAREELGLADEQWRRLG